MSKVDNPRVVLGNVPFGSAQYKELLERNLEQQYLRSGGGVSNVGTLSDDLTSLTVQVNTQYAMTTAAITQSQADIVQLQTDLAAAQASLTTAQDDITALQAENAQQATAITDLQNRVTALENP